MFVNANDRQRTCSRHDRHASLAQPRLLPSAAGVSTFPVPTHILVVLRGPGPISNSRPSKRIRGRATSRPLPLSVDVAAGS